MNSLRTGVLVVFALAACSSPPRLRPPTLDAEGATGPAFQVWVGTLDVIPQPVNENDPEYAVFVTRIGVPEAIEIARLETEEDAVWKRRTAWREKNRGRARTLPTRTRKPGGSAARSSTPSARSWTGGSGRRGDS